MPATDPFDAAFDALGDPQRREILRLLGNSELAVQRSPTQLPISRPAVSRHLRLLKEAGLVEEEPQGTRRIYRLREEGVRAVQDYLEQVWGEAAARFRLAAENLGEAGRAPVTESIPPCDCSSSSRALRTRPSTPGRDGSGCGGRPTTR